MQDHAAEARSLANARVWPASERTTDGNEEKRTRTDMQHVVVPTEPVDGGLLRGRLVLHDPIWLAVFRDRLRLWWPRDALRKARTGGLCAEVEGGRLQ